MNNAKMWLVVKPTVGIPIFLGAVAVGSFAVHLAVVSNTDWVSDFLMGNEMGSGDASASLVLPEADDGTAKASYMLPADEGQVITVILPDGTTARAILQPPEIMAAAIPD